MPKTEKELLEFINDKIDSIDGKVTSLNDKVHSIDNTVSLQQQNLREHMRRTALNEQHLKIFEKRVAPALDAYKFVATCLKICIPLLAAAEIYFKYFRD